MWKRLSTLVFLQFISFVIFAGKQEYRLTGYMGIQGGESFNYRLELKDSVGSWLSGYAYTYNNPQQDVKSYVVAQLNRANRTLTITEKQIIENNNFQSKAVICLVNATLTLDDEHNKLSGKLRTHTAGVYQAECAKGSITFLNQDEITAVFSQPQKKEEEPVNIVAATPKQNLPPAKTSAKPAPVAQAKPKPATAKPIAQITEGKDKVYTWQSDRIVLQLFDGTTVDNDIVSVYYNGEKVLHNFSLRKEVKELILPIGGNELNIISIEANNEGGNPPNTANILLLDGTVRYEVIAHNKTGKRALIRIKRDTK